MCNQPADLNSIALCDVGGAESEPLPFQYQPVDATLLPQHDTSSASKRRKAKAVYREQVSRPSLSSKPHKIHLFVCLSVCQDRFLPLHNVARTMRNAIPPNGKVSKDAKECMQECVSECISFITSE